MPCAPARLLAGGPNGHDRWAGTSSAYTKIELVERDLKVSRLTATKYLAALAGAGFVQKVKVGRSNYYINVALNEILTRQDVVGVARP